MIVIIFILPIIQLMILSNAATFEVKNIHFSFVDQDHSTYSRALMQKFVVSEHFSVHPDEYTMAEATQAMQEGEIDVILQIPRHFERDLVKDTRVSVQLIVNAIDGAAAGVESVYVHQIIGTFNRSVQTELMSASSQQLMPMRIETIPSFWYNKTLNYKTFMVPGILVLLVTMVTLFLAGMNIVREKEIGTLEQINVTPIKKHQFIIGKLFPFWVIGLLLLSVGLVLAKVIFSVPMLGSIVLMYGFTAIYLLVVLGLGLFISNYTDTQQQAMFIAWFFMVIFILMSGLFTPIESMPGWAQSLTDINPIKYYVEVMRMVMLKGAGLREILPQTLKISLYALVVNALAVWSYRKVG